MPISGGLLEWTVFLGADTPHAAGTRVLTTRVKSRRSLFFYHFRFLAETSLGFFRTSLGVLGGLGVPFGPIGEIFRSRLAILAGPLLLTVWRAFVFLRALAPYTPHRGKHFCFREFLAAAWLHAF